MTVTVEASVPEFIYPIDNITVAAGRDAQFTCVVNNLEGHKVGFLVFSQLADIHSSRHVINLGQWVR